MPKKSKMNQQKRKPQPEPEPSPEPEPEMDDMDMDEMPDGMDMGDMPNDGPLFWSMKVEANKATDIDQPAIPNYIVHITNACFGPSVKSSSRSVVMVSTTNEDDEEDSEGFPICVLRQGECENQSLDLLFNESASLTVKGKNASTVYLTGYIQPPVSGDDLGAMDPSMMEDMDEQQIMETLREQKRQQRELDGDDEEPQLDSGDDDDDEVDEPPTKKQRTAKGQKATANGAKADKKRKNAKSSDDEEDEDEEEEVKPKKGKKGKKMKTMGGGIQYKDMQDGKGKEAKKGDKLRVYYVGQTQDKEVFDKAITGNGFEFTLGKGEVIKGWDMGCKGMRVGGKRKLVIPSKLAYGTEGSPPTIPPNADLTFTIMIKAINGQS